MLEAIKHITDATVFLSRRQRTGAHALCVQHLAKCIHVCQSCSKSKVGRIFGDTV